MELIHSINVYLTDELIVNCTLVHTITSTNEFELISFSSGI